MRALIATRATASPRLTSLVLNRACQEIARRVRARLRAVVHASGTSASARTARPTRARRRVDFRVRRRRLLEHRLNPGETVHEATCGSTESGRVDTHPCPATACDDDQENRRCKSCNDGFRNHWLNPGSWYEGYASSCVECSYDDMKDKDKLHNGCECVHYPHFCTSSDQCCGKNVCHGWSLEKGFDGRVCGPSCISNGESCEFIKCCDGLSCQQPDNTCVKN